MTSDTTERVDALMTSLAVLDLRPGDQLVLMTAHRLSEDTRRNLIATFNRFFPDRKVIVLEEGMSLGVVREVS